MTSSYIYFSGHISLHKALDYETVKHLIFDVIATTSDKQGRDSINTVRTKTRVQIDVIDVDDNCPIFTTPKYFEVTMSSPIQANTFVTYVKVGDNDSMKNHSYSLSSRNFMINSNGFIMSRHLLSSVIDRFFNVSIEVKDSKCSAVSHVGIRLKACANPSTYMFTSNGMYIVNVFENATTGNAIATVGINGAYSRSFSIIGASANKQFEMNKTSGKTVFLFELLPRCWTLSWNKL